MAGKLFIDRFSKLFLKDTRREIRHASQTTFMVKLRISRKKKAEIFVEYIYICRKVDLFTLRVPSIQHKDQGFLFPLILTDQDHQPENLKLPSRKRSKKNK